MSKPTTLRTNKKSTIKNIEIKPREASKDRNGIRKTSKPVENGNGLPANIKSKPSVKTTESSSTTSNGIKKSLKNELIKKDHKTKPKVESHRSSLTAPDKISPKANKTVTATKTSASPNQGILTKTKRSTAPETPPSSRVTKTQYFPNKKMYSNVVKEQLKTKLTTTQRADNVEATTSNKELSKNRAVPPNEIKIGKNKLEPVTKTNEKSKLPKNKVPRSIITDTVERPRTATLKRGSIVNSNIAGPDIPISETPSLTSLDLSYEQEEEEVAKQEVAKQGVDYDYEDDFESYESDFEEYQSSESLSSTEDNNLLSGEEATTSDDTSSFDDTPKQSTTAGTDEERMLDSGNFDMPENKHKPLLDNIKESSEQENFTMELKESSRSNMASLSDEGFEEGKSSLQSGNMQFINFVGAQKKWKQNKNLEKRRKRGEEILNMIRLDHYNFTLIDMPPVSYNDFIKSYGKTNTIQVPTQTGDDDTSEEVQTDLIEATNKWTQFPVTFSKIDTTNSNYMEIYKKEFIGVGDDSDIKADSAAKQDFASSKRLRKFLSLVSQIILTLLEESNHNTSEGIHKNQREIPFSNGYIKFDTKLHMFLNNRPVTFISYCSTTNIKVLTIHGRNKEAHDNTDDDLSLKSIVCIWNLINSKEPAKVLAVTGELRVCCFTSEIKNLIFGGLHDGSIVTWDVSEDNQLELFDNIVNKKNYIQQPCYTSEIGYGHSSSVVSIQPLVDSTDNFVQTNFEWKSSNNQICSLDDNGILIVWGVITRNNSSFNNFNKHSVMPWSHISLVKNSKISFKDFNPELTDLLCTDMNINIMDPRHLFISTNYGYIIHCLATETKANPKKFNPGTILQANCLESCPFSPLYFFAGHDDGAIVLYSRLLEKPLMVMSNKDDTLQSGIELIQWSHHRPCVFYTKDHCNTIHVWDLAISDLYPIYSIPFKENITCMKLSPTLLKNNDTSYMILATESGSVHLHILNVEYGPSTLDRYEQDLKKFLNYVSRL